MTLKLNDRRTLDGLRTGINAALADFAKQHGITIQAEKITYEGDGSACTVKLAVAVPELKAQHDDAELRTWAEISGLDPDRVSVDGYKLVAFDAKRRTRPWIGEKNGKRYVFDDTAAKMRWAKPQAA